MLDAIDAATAADLTTPKVLATLQDALRDPEITAEGLRTLVAADALLGLELATLDPGDVDQRRAAEDLPAEERQAISRSFRMWCSNR